LTIGVIEQVLSPFAVPSLHFLFKETPMPQDDKSTPGINLSADDIAKIMGNLPVVRTVGGEKMGKEPAYPAAGAAAPEGTPATAGCGSVIVCGSW
jgi:hypothetical protein